MPVIIRNVPPGFNWGWYSREDPCMHVQTLDGPEYKIWLEEAGKRVFEPVGRTRWLPTQVFQANSTARSTCVPGSRPSS